MTRSVSSLAVTVILVAGAVWIATTAYRKVKGV